MSTAQICPVVGTSTSVLPPDHPKYDASDKSLVCPVTLAKTSHHNGIHSHPSADTSESEITNSEAHGSSLADATCCPALKNAQSDPSTLAKAICPVVGPVSAVLPPDHPLLNGVDEDKVCPKTNATMAHHKNGKVVQHPNVEKGADVAACPVAGQTLA